MGTNRRPCFSPLLVADEGECQPCKDKEDCYKHRFIANKRPLGLVPQVVELQELHVAMYCEKGVPKGHIKPDTPASGMNFIEGRTA